MRSAFLPVIIAMALIFTAFPVSAATNHVLKVYANFSNVSNTLYLTYSNNQTITDFSIDIKIYGTETSSGKKVKFFSEDQSGTSIANAVFQFDIYLRQIQYYNSTGDVLNLANWNEGWWYHIRYYIQNGTPYVDVNGHVAELGAPFDVTLKIQMYFYAGGETVYLDNFYVNGELVEDFEDAQNEFSETDVNNVYDVSIVEDPTGVAITFPTPDASVSIPFYINFTNPDGTNYTKIYYDYDILIYNGTAITSLLFDNVSLISPGWHTFTIYAYDENMTTLGWGKIHLYVENGAASDSGNTGTATGDSDSSGTSDSSDSGSSGSSGAGSSDSGLLGDFDFHLDRITGFLTAWWFLLALVPLIVFFLLGGRRRW